VVLAMVALCCSCLKPSDVAETSPTTELLAKATQLSATETAAATAKRVAQAARRVSAAEKAAVGSQWVSAGGPAMEAMLVSTDLVDAQYLVALAEAGGIVPSWQECPLEARINRDSVWRLRCWGFVNLPVLVLSYPWLDAHHPDRLGETLRSIVPVLRALLAKAAEYGTHATIGVLWDFLSLPQKPYRDEAEAARFKAGLRSINSWYSHPCTHVLLVKTPLPVGADYGNTRPYSARGWTYFEERMSAVVKDDYCLWDLSRYEGAADYVTCLRQMRHQRLPPTSPERVAAELREGVASGALAFTASADLETVIGLYSRGFETAFDSYRAIREVSEATR